MCSSSFDIRKFCWVTYLVVIPCVVAAMALSWIVILKHEHVNKSWKMQIINITMHRFNSWDLKERTQNKRQSLKRLYLMIIIRSFGTIKAFAHTNTHEYNTVCGAQLYFRSWAPTWSPEPLTPIDRGLYISESFVRGVLNWFTDCLSPQLPIPFGPVAYR